MVSQEQFTLKQDSGVVLVATLRVVSSAMAYIFHVVVCEITGYRN
jgi:hypothetical protein